MRLEWFYTAHNKETSLKFERSGAAWRGWAGLGGGPGQRGGAERGGDLPRQQQLWPPWQRLHCMSELLARRLPAPLAA